MLGGRCWDEHGCGLAADVAVPHSGEGNDDIGFLRIDLKFVPQSGHVPLQRVQRAPVISPDFVQEFLMTQNPVTIERHIGEQTVLGGTHLYRFTTANSAI